HKGCDSCCYIQVSVSPPEIFYIANRLKTFHNFPEILERIDKSFEVMNHKRHPNRPVHPCPFLVDHQCSIYEFRPGTCRQFSSYSDKACKQGLINQEKGLECEVPTGQIRMHVCQIPPTALVKKLIDMGLEFHGIELIEGLHLALHDPTAQERWLNGEAVFADCVLGVVNPNEIIEAHSRFLNHDFMEMLIQKVLEMEIESVKSI